MREAEKQTTAKAFRGPNPWPHSTTTRVAPIAPCKSETRAHRGGAWCRIELMSGAHLLALRHIRRQRTARRALGAVTQGIFALHDGVNLARALIDNRRLGVAQVAEYRIFVAVAVGAVYFDRVRGGIKRGIAGVPLRQRDGTAGRLAQVLEPARLQLE